MNRPRIAVVAASLDILGGQAVQAATLVESLRRDGWTVSFVAANPPFPRPLRWLRRVRYARTILGEALHLAALEALRRADVVHVFCASYWSFLLAAAPALWAARRLGRRAVLNYHSGEADDHLGRYGPLVHPVIRLADAIVVPSEYLRGVFARHGWAARVVRNVVRPDRFRWRERWPLRPALLSNRNLEPHYRVDDAIRAFARIRRRHPDARLVVAGAGREETRLRTLAASLADGAVSFAGRVDPARMPALHEACDVLVNASVVDNQPLSLLEAFASGLPVVTTPTGDIPNMVRHGEAGLLAPARDPEALADAVETLLLDPDLGRRLARMARRELEAYRWEAVRDAWRDVYVGKPT